MIKINTIIYIFGVFALVNSLVSCGSSSGKLAKPGDIPNSKNIVYLKNNSNVNSPEDLEKLVKGSKVNYSKLQKTYIWRAPDGGVILSGKKQRGDGGQSEGQEPLITFKESVVLKSSKKNPWLVEDNKDGMRFYGDNWGLDGVFFLNSGEDCVTSYGEYGFIYRSTFIGDSDSDKIIQANIANGIRITNNRFYNAITAIQCGLRKYSSKNDVFRVENNKFYNCETAIRAVKGKLVEKNNEFNGAKVVMEK